VVNVIRYEQNKKDDWNSFLINSKNGNFIFNRNYMDYHSSRFIDHSLLCYYKNKIIALIPANEVGETIISHGGLTFGGIITANDMRAKIMIDIFGEMIDYYKENSKTKIVYKTIPFIYHKKPSGEDLYALFKYGGKLYRRDISTVVDLKNKIKFNKLRKRGIKRAKSNNLTIKRDNNFEVMLEYLNIKLREKYKTQSVHTLDEICLLANKFPKNIIQYSVYKNELFVAGTILYLSDIVAHAQYIISSPLGQELGALDLLFDFLINDNQFEMKYFDFGISTENEGKFLNEGLIQQKEGFGGRAITYDTYRIDIDG
jgi:hypothetical protein